MIANSQNVTGEWVTFPGGELEGRRPKVLCPACRKGLNQALCFQCYRAGLNREQGIKAAGLLDTATDERFQTVLPLEPVNVQRLQMLKVDRAAARETARQGVGQYVDRRRRAQIAARHALQRVFAGVQRRQACASSDGAAGERMIAAAVHAAELQLPEAWLPFVVSR